MPSAEHTFPQCEKAIEAAHPGRLSAFTAKEGDEVVCPGCGRRFVHICDEAEGCCWVKSAR